MIRYDLIYTTVDHDGRVVVVDFNVTKVNDQSESQAEMLDRKALDKANGMYRLKYYISKNESIATTATRAYRLVTDHMLFGDIESDIKSIYVDDTDVVEWRAK